MDTEPEWSVRGLLIWLLLGLNCFLLLVQVSPTFHARARAVAVYIAEGGEKAKVLQKTSWRHNLGYRDERTKWSNR